LVKGIMRFRKEGGFKVKKLLILAIAASVLVFGFSTAQAFWSWQYPSGAMVFPYFNATSGFQTFVLISQSDTDPDWGQNDISPNVVVKFNPKCGRGQSRSFSLTTKQSFVVTPPQAIEGWVEAFVKDDVEGVDDGYVSRHSDALSGLAVILDIGNGITYSLESTNYRREICADSASEPLFYNCDCDGDCDTPDWGDNADPSVLYARLWRNSEFGRSMFVLCDPSGRHLDADIPDPAPAAGWIPSALYVGNRAQLDIYSKSETDAHLSVDWCTGDDAGKPGIVTIGVGTTDGPLGTTDTSIADPAATSTDAPYGFGQAYELRTKFWVDDNNDGLMQVGEDYDDYSNILGAVLTRISNDYFPHATHAQSMANKYTKARFCQ
jgi:hypothetical protein